MSRKSLTKTKPVWYECQNCRVTILAKDCESHEQFCENASNQQVPFIKNFKLWTKTCEDIEVTNLKLVALDKLTEKQRNSIVFISEETIRLCQLKIGELVSLSIPKISDFGPVIRMVWPIDNKYGGQIFVSKTDYQLNWKDFHGKETIIIEKILANPVTVSEIIMEIKNENFSFKDSESLCRLLEQHMSGRVYILGSIINFNFFNQPLKLQIKHYQTPIKKSESENLEKQIEHLSITTLTYLYCTKKTNVNLHTKNENMAKIHDDINQNAVKLSDVGGLDETIRIIKDQICIALGLTELSSKIKISRGILFHGPSGCGKTLLAEGLANNFSENYKVEIIRIKSNEIFSKFFGETELNLQKQFNRAFDIYPRPCIIILEDINNLCPKFETIDVVKRVAIAFLNLLDSVHLKTEGNKLFIIATTNNIDNLNPGLRRCGRFDNEIEIPVPSPKDRYEILYKNLQRVDHILTEEQIKEISNITHGFVGSDLANLIYKAAMNCLNNEKAEKGISAEDINIALNFVKPSAMRQILIDCPNVKWNDIGGQHELKLKLKQAIEWPLLYPDKFIKLGIKPPRGILMFGPPGCSKTMIAKALATESRLNFLSIKGPELFSMWVGESERAVREVFRKARQVAPAIIFFDEIDAIGGERSFDGQSSSVKERVLTQLLTELDGVESLKDVTIVAATNRPDMIDKALLRPGRIDRLVYVGLPDDQTREEIFKIKLKEMPLSKNVSLNELVQITKGYSGAELQAICHEAALKALEENLEAEEISWENFEFALNLVKPRTSKELLDLYESYMKDKF